MTTTITSPVPRPQQLLWQQTETNLFIHFGINTFTGREWGYGTEDPRFFNPTRLDCRQWAAAAKTAGMKIAILTAKHHDGFCLWPSRMTHHSVKSSPWRDGVGDLVREFVDAMRAQGIRPGLYLSPWDRHEKTYGDSPRYNDYYCAQLRELLTQYGPLAEVWFDGACGEGPNGKRQVYDWQRIFATVKELQPDAVTFGDGGTDVRWVGNEEGFAGEECWSTVIPSLIRFPGDGTAQGKSHAHSLHHGDRPDGVSERQWRPAESDVSIRPGWFYHESEDDKVRTVDNLVQLYFNSVGRNSLLLLNVPPTREGLFHEVDVARLKGMREALDRTFAHNLVTGCHIRGNVADVQLSGDANVICLQERIEHGQQIARFRIEADGTPLIEGTTVGYKRLLRVPTINARTIRVTADPSADALSRIAVYHDDNVRA